MMHVKQHRIGHTILTILIVIGLLLTTAQNSHALVADDENGFDTGGDPPVHSWTNNPRPNRHTRIFTNNGQPIEPLEARANPPGVYRDTVCTEATAPNLSPIFLSVCQQREMARQIHEVVKNYVRAFMLMTQQFTATMMHQVFAIGMFMDADMQIDTQREIQTLVAKAHKDYHPSEQMCRIGTFMRSVADTQERIDLNKQTINAIMMDTYLGKSETISARGYALDMKSRIEKFKHTYCDKADNNNGLERFCQNSRATRERYNNDIDYQRIIDLPLTLDVDYTDTQKENIEEDIVALARNLYWPEAIEIQDEDELQGKKSKYKEFRNLVAVNNIAHTSFAKIVAIKGRAEKVNDTEAREKGWHYMKELMRELGVKEDENLDKLLGEYPSYYAQMEVLTKKIYQDPDFYTNLYDKPQNVRRISASLDAIKLMQGHDRFEASLRREMLISALLEQALEKHVMAIDPSLQNN